MGEDNDIWLKDDTFTYVDISGYDTMGTYCCAGPDLHIVADSGMRLNGYKLI
jgi:hypothetical protein